MEKMTPEMFDIVKDAMIEGLTEKCAGLEKQLDLAVQVAIRHGALSFPCDCSMCIEIDPSMDLDITQRHWSGN